MPQKQCLPSNEACDGACTAEESICPTTNLCYPESKTTPCDENTCLLGQTLVQSDDSTRSCALSSSLSQIGQACTEQNYVYCEEIDTCSNLTAPHLCNICPEGEIACDDTKVCVNDTKYCCGENGYYCSVLSQCLGNGETCVLPNIAPTIAQQLIYYGMIENVLSDSRGRMIGTLLGDDNILGTDEQGEEIGIAIVEVSNISATEGEWQYSECFEGITVCKECSNVSLWMSIRDNVSESNALYLPNTACLRFVRKSLNIVGASWMRVKAWDGNEDGYISPGQTMVRYQDPFIGSTVPYTSNGPVSRNSVLLSALLLPVNSYPMIEESAPQLTDIVENSELQMNIGDSLIDITKSVFVEHLPVLTEDSIDRLPTVDGEGISIDYTDLFPIEAIEKMYAEIKNVNPIRSERISTDQKPAVAVRLDSDDSGEGDWQISVTGDPQLYTYITDTLEGSTNNLLLLNTSALVRYIPKQHFSGIATLTLYPWDGVMPGAFNQHKVNDVIVRSASLSNFLSHSLNNKSLLSVSVSQIQQPPVIVETSVQMSPIAYAMMFVYSSLYTVTIQKSYDTLNMDANDIQNILYLVLNHPVTVYHVFPGSNSRYVHLSI